MISCSKEREETFQKQEEDKLERHKLRKQNKEEMEKSLVNKETSKSSTTSRKRAGVKEKFPEECNY